MMKSQLHIEGQNGWCRQHTPGERCWQRGRRHEEVIQGEGAISRLLAAGDLVRALIGDPRSPH
jgi:hypothetical protein